MTSVFSVCVRTAIYQKMDTSMGLSTIASLSLGLSMSMTGAGRAVICRSIGSNASPQPSPPQSAGVASSNGGSSSTGGGQLSTTTAGDDDLRRCSLQQLFPLPVSPGVLRGDCGLRAPSLGQRRTSFVGIMQHMSAAAQNRLGLLLEPSINSIGVTGSRRYSAVIDRNAAKCNPITVASAATTTVENQPMTSATIEVESQPCDGAVDVIYSASTTCSGETTGNFNAIFLFP